LNKINGLLLAVLLPACSVANESPLSIPTDPTQRLIGSAVGMTVETLFQAYMSAQPEQRRLAEMYVVGVLDSSEGESWCGYQEVGSPDGLQEQIYLALKRAVQEAPKARASSVIKSRLTNLLACKEAE
jgi:hypothetical protein